jgi:hypothetical protein
MVDVDFSPRTTGPCRFVTGTRCPERDSDGVEDTAILRSEAAV